MSTGLAVTVMLLAWWAGTGAVFLCGRLPRTARRIAFGAATLGLVPLFLALPAFSYADTAVQTCWALLAGFGVWAWVELSFYTGFIVGPSTDVPPEGASLRVRFEHAFRACMWHELVIPLLAIGIWAWSPGPSKWALGIYLVFWVLHEAARINVLIGVPHPFRELLPEHLAHLQPYLEPAPARSFLDWTLVAHAAALAGAGWAFWSFAGPARFGWAAVIALVALGVLEHGVLKFPVKLERLWQSFGMVTARIAEPQGAKTR
jgi:putative photosynthetic complex assembly protein 2